MIDPFVLLAPIFLLAVVALLQFVGCDVILHLDPIYPPPPLKADPIGTPNSYTGNTNPFSANANELLLAFVAAGQDVVTGVSTPGVNFALVVKETGGGGSAEIWQAVPSSDLTDVVVTAAAPPGSSVFVYVVAFSATGTSGTTTPTLGNTAHSSGSDGQPIASLVTTSANAFIFGVANDYDRPTTPQEGANQKIVQPFITDTVDNNTFWVQTRTDTASANTQVQIDDTLVAGDHWNLCICEVHA